MRKRENTKWITLRTTGNKRYKDYTVYESLLLYPLSATFGHFRINPSANICRKLFTQNNKWPNITPDKVQSTKVPYAEKSDGPAPAGPEATIAFPPGQQDPAPGGSS